MASFLARWVALFSFVYPCVMEGMPGSTFARQCQGGGVKPRTDLYITPARLCLQSEMLRSVFLAGDVFRILLMGMWKH